MNSTFTNLCQTQPATLSSITTNPKNAWKNLYEGRPQVTYNQSTHVYKAEVLFTTPHEVNLYLKASRDLEIKIYIIKKLHFLSSLLL